MQIIKESISFSPITILIETEKELQQLRGMLNYSPIIRTIPIAEGIKRVVGCEDNEYWRLLKDDAAGLKDKKED